MIDERYLFLFIISLSIFVLALLFFTLFPIFRKLYIKKNFLSYYGKTVYNIALKEDYYLINKLVLSRADGTAIHIDHFLAGNKFLYVIKDKYYDGAIMGAREDKTWILLTKDHKGRRKSKFDNQLLLNDARIQKLIQITNIDPTYLINIVLINDDAIIDTPLELKNYEGNSFIIKRKQLRKLIKKIEKRDISPLNPTELKHIVKDINALNANNEIEKDR